MIQVDQKATQEVLISSLKSGYLGLVQSLAILGLAIALFLFAANTPIGDITPLFVVCIIVGVLLILTSLVWLFGLTVIEPNQAKVLILFGDYKGTVKSPGFYWVNPFMLRRHVSLRVRNFNSDTLKVNDKHGNPIEIATVVVWRVVNTAQAIFDVDDFVHYVQVQSESAVRHLASTHPYDDSDDNATSLRGSGEGINEELRVEVLERLQVAGVEVPEARISHLAYAPEIAGAMLQRQQADAIIAARRRIVDGAVGMVEMALADLAEKKVVELDDERRATMVSNLLVVLCSERATMPVVNAGSLYT